MNPSKISILTNDLQYDLVEKAPERISAINAALPSYQKFLQNMRDFGCPIFHLQLINLPDDPNVELHNGRMLATKGTRGAEIIEAFLGEGDIVVEKNKDSGFYETDLDRLLKERLTEIVIVTGMQTQICVQTTAADAFFRGYNVWVPDDCVVSARLEDKTRSLQWLDGYCATVTSSEDIISRLRTGADFPRKSSVTP